MAVMASPVEVLARVRADVERQAIRARNGVKYFAGIGRPQVGQTPKDVVWKRDKVELWRYRSDRRRWRPPVFVVYSLICRSYRPRELDGRPAGRPAGWSPDDQDRAVGEVDYLMRRAAENKTSQVAAAA